MRPENQRMTEFLRTAGIDVRVKFIWHGSWKIWTWCLMKANHEDRWVPIKTGRGETQALVKRGQFLFGRKTAAKELKMRPTTVVDRMKKLANMQNLVINPVTHYSIVTVCNYEFYQGNENSEASPNPSPNRQPTVTNKNDKNEKNNTLSGKKTPDPRVKQFFKFWGETSQEGRGQGLRKIRESQPHAGPPMNFKLSKSKSRGDWI